MKKLSKSFEQWLNYYSSAVHYFKGALSRQEELNVLQGLDISDILEPLPKERWRKGFVFFHPPKLVLTIEYHPNNYIIE